MLIYQRVVATSPMGSTRCSNPAGSDARESHASLGADGSLGSGRLWGHDGEVSSGVASGNDEHTDINGD